MLNKRSFLTALGALALSPVNALARASKPDFNESRIDWRSYRSGLNEAKRTRKPIFMLVHATWCPACREYRDVFFDKRVEQLSKKFVFVLVDVDQSPKTAAKYARDGGYVPRSMILEPNGAHRINATSGEREYKYFLDPSSPRALIRFLKANS